MHVNECVVKYCFVQCGKSSERVGKKGTTNYWHDMSWFEVVHSDLVMISHGILLK